MNKTLNTILLVLVILILAGGIFLAGGMYARSNMMFGWDNNQYGPGMMNNGSMMNMMGGTGGMMTGSGMMEQYGYGNSNVSPLTVDQAKDAAVNYIQSLNVDGFELGEVMIFDNHAYVVVEETKTGLGAFELLVDPVTQTAYPEHGPNMMWNVKYGGLNHQSMMKNGNGMMGMMGGNGVMGNMIGGWDGSIPADVSADMPVTPEESIEFAQTYLDANIADVTVSTGPIQFYGYYTLDYEQDEKVIGMLSVNGYSGQVFVHTWHGIFIEEAE